VAKSGMKVIKAGVYFIQPRILQFAEEFQCSGFCFGPPSIGDKAREQSRFLSAPDSFQKEGQPQCRFASGKNQQPGAWHFSYLEKKRIKDFLGHRDGDVGTTSDAAMRATEITFVIHKKRND
jgi:hypothetical protein